MLIGRPSTNPTARRSAASGKDAAGVETELFAGDGFDRRCHAPVRVARRDADGFGAEIEADQRAAWRQQERCIGKGKHRHGARLARVNVSANGYFSRPPGATMVYCALVPRVSMQPVRVCLAAAFAAVIMVCAMSQSAAAAEIKVISGGAFKTVLNASRCPVRERKRQQCRRHLPDRRAAFEADRRRRGEIRRRGTDAGSHRRAHKEGKVAPGSRADLAKTGVGVVVKAGAPLPDIGTVEAFKRTLLAAKSVAYIDPAAGGSSGIYVGKLLERLGIAKEVNAKAVLVQGGEVAAHMVDGEAEVGIHQISEILAVKGAVLVGPLPAEIQNFTVYSAGVAAGDGAAAKSLVKFLSGPHALPIIKSKGMEPAGS